MAVGGGGAFCIETDISFSKILVKYFTFSKIGEKNEDNIQSLENTCYVSCLSFKKQCVCVNRVELVSRERWASIQNEVFE